MASVYESLLEAVKHEKPDFSGKKVGESDNEYIHRVLKELSTVSDATWNSIPEAAQAWSNEAVALISSNQPCPECPGYSYSGSEQVEGREQTPTSKSKQISMEPVKRKPSAMHRIRQLALLNPNFSPEVLLEMVTNEGLKCGINSAYVCKDEVRNVLRAAKEIGYSLVQEVPTEKEELVGANK
jgi:hypothetical protein